jgi:hypothetical protein
MGQSVYEHDDARLRPAAARVPLRHESIMRAIGGVQQTGRLQLGRRCRPGQRRVAGQSQVITFNKRKTLNEMLDQRVRFLTSTRTKFIAASSRRYARRKRRSRHAEAVARNLFKLMACKDEYEVARRHTSPAFPKQIADTFEGDFKLVHCRMLSRRGANGAGEWPSALTQRDAGAGAPEGSAPGSIRSATRRAPRRRALITSTAPASRSCWAS